MNKKLLPLLGLSFVVLAGCTTNDISSDISSQSGEIIATGPIDVSTGYYSDLLSPSDLSGYATVSLLDSQYFGKQRSQGEQWFYKNDKNRIGNYYAYRNWILIGAMGVQAADVFYGYISGGLFIEVGSSVIKFPVDEKTYISYYPQLENPNYTGTGDMKVEDKRLAYKVCKDGFMMEQEEIVYDRDRYEALVVKNPMRCFGEDKTYIYARREYRKSENSGYELMRMKK